MSSTETDTDYLLNLFNIPKPNSKCTQDPSSPSPSAQSENSVECNQNTNDTVASTDEDSEELTNLTWLTQLKNLAAWPDSVNPILDEEDIDDKPKVTNVLKKDTAADRFNKFIDQVVKSRANYDASAELLQSNSEVKPTFNYALIIGMAMHENGRMTLQQICAWIERKFAYFRVRKNYNNSIRHNLSLHCCFRKIDRSKNERGKGGYWELGIDITKCERKRVRNRKPRLISNNNNNKDDAIDGCADNKRTKVIHHEQSPNIDEEEVMQDFFGEDGLREFNLETNLDVTSVIEQTFNDIEAEEIYYSDKHISKVDSDLHRAVASITQDELNVVFENEENFLLSNDGVSSTIGMLKDDFRNATVVDPITMHIQNDQIYLANEVPQPSENVVISILNNHPCDGPNVIVEPIPYAMSIDDTYKPYFDGIDEEFQFLRNCENRDDLIDSLYDIATNDF